MSQTNVESEGGASSKAGNGQEETKVTAGAPKAEESVEQLEEEVERLRKSVEESDEQADEETQKKIEDLSKRIEDLRQGQANTADKNSDVEAPAKGASKTADTASVSSRTSRRSAAALSQADAGGSKTSVRTGGGEKEDGAEGQSAGGEKLSQTGTEEGEAGSQDLPGKEGAAVEPDEKSEAGIAVNAAVGDDKPLDTAGDPAAEESQARGEASQKADGEQDSPQKAPVMGEERQDRATESTEEGSSQAPSSRRGSSRADSRMSRADSRISRRKHSRAGVHSEGGSQSGSLPASRKGRRGSETPNVLKDIPSLRRRQRGDGQAESESEDKRATVGATVEEPKGELLSSPKLSLHANPMDQLVGPIFRTADVNNDLKLTVEEIFRIFRSPELGLHLSKADLVEVQKSLGLKESSYLTYPEFVPLAQAILMRVYQQQDPSFAEWIELVTANGDVVWFNKFTGDASFHAPEGLGTATYGEVNLIEDVIREIFESVDTQRTGFLSQSQFVQLLQSDQLGLFLTNEEIAEMAAYFNMDANGHITFEEFVPLAKQLIMMIYQRRDPSSAEWCRLNSRRSGLFWFNKRTGETRRKPPDEYLLDQQAEQEARQQEIAFVQQTLSDLKGAEYELEQQRLHTAEVENELAVIAEEAELTMAQLDQTGQQLDAANVIIKEQEGTLQHHQEELKLAENRIKELQERVSEMEQLREELRLTQQELGDTRDVVVLRDSVIEEREQSISDLGVQMSRLTLELKNVTSTMHSHEETISQLQEQLRQQQAENRALEKDLLQVPEVQGELQKTETLLMQTQKHLDEKASALSATRKTMRNIKEKNQELEQGLQVASEVRDKLHSARCEVHTLRQFVSGKTALVLQRERELETAKRRMREMEEKDQQRAQVLASVLERTARLQQQLQATSQHTRTRSEGNAQELERPLSCPALLPLPSESSASAPYYSTQAEEAHVGQHSTYHSMPVGHPPPSRAPLKLPPVSRNAGRPRTQNKPFLPVTPADVKSRQRTSDMIVTGPLFPSNLEPGKSLKTLSLSYALPEDTEGAADAVAAQQLRIGDRVLVRRKRMPWESEASKSTGLVKFIGRIDSEYVDHRIYVGLRLDNADGEHDGVVKGKRYFRCTPKHGLMVRVTEVVSALPPKSLTYRPLLTSEVTA